MSAPTDLGLEQLSAQAGTLRIFRQVFAVLARETGAMIDDVEHLDTDDAILRAFADSGADGLTLDQVTARCRPLDARLVARRFEVLRGYGAIAKVVDRPHERRHRAAFAPYVMLLFLRRMAAAGGQGELHQLLTLEGIGVRAPDAGPLEGAAAVGRLVTVFRLMANQLVGLVAASPVEELREHAEMLWGNRTLIAQAQDVHATVLRRWPRLDRECAGLRTALAAYGDASDAAASRLLEQAGATRALGFLPAETWRTFARTTSAEDLAAVLEGVLFDAPAPWFSPQALTEAVAEARPTGPTRQPPPRPSGEGAPAPPRPVDDVADLGELAERVLAGADTVDVGDLLDGTDGWPAARRLLARLTAAHHHVDVPVELVWSDDLDVAPDGVVPWRSGGALRRVAPDDPVAVPDAEGPG